MSDLLSVLRSQCGIAGDEAADEIERLTRELANALVNDVHSCGPTCTRAGCVAAGLREDAERYRWLRDKARTVDWTQHIEHKDFCDAYECHTRIGPQGMDAAIDAARGAKP